MEWFTGKSGPEAEGYTKMPDDKATPAAADPPPVKPNLSRQETAASLAAGKEEPKKQVRRETMNKEDVEWARPRSLRALQEGSVKAPGEASVCIAYSLDSTQIASAVGDKIILQFTVDTAHVDKSAVGSTVDKSASKDQGSSLVKPDDGEMEIEVGGEVNTLSFGPPVDTDAKATNVHDRAAGTIAAGLVTAN